MCFFRFLFLFLFLFFFLLFSRFNIFFVERHHTQFFARFDNLMMSWWENRISIHRIYSVGGIQTLSIFFPFEIQGIIFSHKERDTKRTHVVVECKFLSNNQIDTQMKWVLGPKRICDIVITNIFYQWIIEPTVLGKLKR